MMSGPNVSGQAVRCPKCALSLEAAVFVPGQWVDCPACRSQLSAVTFRALEHPPTTVTTATGEKAIEGEAACYFHPEKIATVSCARCGRFLCALCDVPFGGKHLCPSCLDSSKMPELQAHRMIWAQLALIVGIAPLVLLFACLWFAWIVTGPLTIFLAIRAWRKPPSLVRGRRLVMATIALILGVLQVAGFVSITVFSIRIFQ